MSQHWGELLAWGALPSRLSARAYKAVQRVPSGLPWVPPNGIPIGLLNVEETERRWLAPTHCGRQCCGCCCYILLPRPTASKETPWVRCKCQSLPTGDLQPSAPSKTSKSVNTGCRTVSSEHLRCKRRRALVPTMNGSRRCRCLPPRSTVV